VSSPHSLPAGHLSLPVQQLVFSFPSSLFVFSYVFGESPLFYLLFPPLRSQGRLILPQLLVSLRTTLPYPLSTLRSPIISLFFYQLPSRHFEFPLSDPELLLGLHIIQAVGYSPFPAFPFLPFVTISPSCKISRRPTLFPFSSYGTSTSFIFMPHL